MTTTDKPWYKSRAFWGVAAALGLRIVEAAGVYIPDLVKAIIDTIAGGTAVVGVRGWVQSATNKVAESNVEAAHIAARLQGGSGSV